MITEDTLIIRHIDTTDYATTWHAMQQFTLQRDAKTQDELWLVEHAPIFTQGQNGKSEHLLNRSSIPVLNVDRGGQITYHGPGQLIAYTLIDLQRKKFTIRDLVTRLENAVIDLLADFSLRAAAKRQAPGIYLDDKKICSLGLRVKRGSAYHGLALNVDMDLSPFSQINPCGYADLKMTQLSDWVTSPVMTDIKQKLINHLLRHLQYNSTSIG